jgi:hypothetical protein
MCNATGKELPVTTYLTATLYGSGIQPGVRVLPEVCEDMLGARKIKKKNNKYKTSSTISLTGLTTLINN